MQDFAKFAVLTKVDEAKREVYGIATQEVLDHSGEMMDYDGSVPYFKAWSASVSKDSGGKSLGNIREQHSNIAAGKVLSMEYVDKKKAIVIGVKVVDDSTWKKVLEGVLTGYSIGGKYVKQWRDDDAGCMKFIADPVEISLVDRPCCPTAILESIKSSEYEFVKSDGTHEMRKFTQKEGESTMTPEQIAELVTKGVADALAKAATERKAADELAKAEQLKKDEALKVTFHARIDEVAVSKGFQKGLYAVSALAEVCSSLFYLYREALYEADCEQDDSTIPEELRLHLNGLAVTFLAMAAEEINELTAQAGEKGDGIMSDLLKTAKGSLMNAFKKSKSYNERIAARHAAIAKQHSDAAETLEKSDNEDSKVIASVFKSITAEHEGLMKCHLSAAEFAGNTANAFSEDEAVAETANKAIEAALAKNDDGPSEETIAELKKNAVQIDTNDVLKKTMHDMQLEAIEKFRNSDEGKALVEKAASEALAAQLGVTLLPTATKINLVPRFGQQTVEEIAKAAEPSPGAGLFSK